MSAGTQVALLRSQTWAESQAGEHSALMQAPARQTLPAGQAGKQPFCGTTQTGVSCVRSQMLPALQSPSAAQAPTAEVRQAATERRRATKRRRRMVRRRR